MATKAAKLAVGGETAVSTPPGAKPPLTTAPSGKDETPVVTLKTNVNQDAGPNPFNFPADEEIFRHREEERKKRLDSRIIGLEESVMDKTTFASRMQATTNEDARNMLKELKIPKGTLKKEPKSLAELSAVPQHRKEKENMSDLIAKKREIFLLQMSLDTKRAEIKKLEERARQREEALKKSEQMLEEDALRFDAFLKENDEKVQEAIKKAEVEAKAKQDKVLEIKRLNTAIAALRSEMNKYEEQLEDCRKFREFLDSITPPEWFEQQALKLALRKEAILADWQAACDEVNKRKEAAVATMKRTEAEFANARTQQEAERAEKAVREAAAAYKESLREKEPPKPNMDIEEVPGEEEMYFKVPQQLLEVYKELEESNLFYIQNAQESEEALEELRSKYRDTRARLDGEIETLNGQIGLLQSAIEAAREKGRRLKERTIENVGGLTLSSMAGNASVSLDQLSSRVDEVYVRCGFDADASIATLQKLTNIETKLEEYLQIIDTMPAESVEAAEKAREKERRKVARDEKMAAQQRDHEARVQRALERAAAPVFKKTGKPVMYRSLPMRKKEVVEEQGQDNDEAELEAYLARDML